MTIRKFKRIILGTNLTGTDNGDDTITIDAATGGSGSVATDSIWDAKGDLAAGTGADTAAKLSVGSNDQVLVADSSQSTGIKWAAVPGTSAFIPVSTIDAKGDLLVGSANDAVDNLGVGSDGQVLTADSAQTLGVKWATAASGSVATDPIWDAKGDLAVGSGSDASDNLAVGSNGFVLTADSGQTLGVKWAAAGASGAWTLLHTITLGSAGTFDQTSISGSYNDLAIVAITRSVENQTTDGLSFRFNGDTGSNYNREGIQVTGTGAVNGFESIGVTALNAGKCPGSGAGALANSFGVLEMIIPGYASTTWLKSLFWQSFATTANSTGNLLMHNGGGTWRSTAAITRVQILNAQSLGNFVTGSQVRIYGRL